MRRTWAPILGAIATTTAVALTPATAYPCSVLPPSQAAVVEGQVSSRPLLIAFEGFTPQLRGGDETVPIDEMPVIEIEPYDPPGLEGAKASSSQPLAFFRPKAPLTPDAYFWGDQSFVVPTSGDAPAHVLNGEVKADLFVREDDGDAFSDIGGCSSELKCGPGVSLQITMSGQTSDDLQPRNYLVAITDSQGNVEKRLVSDKHNFTTMTMLTFHDLHPKRMCLTIAPVSSDGTVGETRDLDCVGQDDSGGCMVSPAPRGKAISISMMWLLAAALFIARRERRRS